MRIEIEIPKEFEKHFAQDKFEDSLQRLGADAHLIAGNYEKELIEMLIEAFKESKEIYDTDVNELPDMIKTLMEEALGEYNMGKYNVDNGIGNKVAETYRQDMNEGKCFAYEEVIDMLSTSSSNAVFVKLPCKVGNTIWFIGSKCDRCGTDDCYRCPYNLYGNKRHERFVYSMKINKFDIRHDEIYMEDSIKTSLNVKSFGKTVFLTKAEAEQKAKEIEHELHEKICKATVTENRQKELSELKFRRFETDLWKEQEELLRKAGYFVYDLRNWDEGDGYNIEIHVSVNHIGNWITDTDLTPYMNQNSWIGIDELESAQIQDIPYNEISDLLLKGDELHKAANNH